MGTFTVTKWKCDRCEDVRDAPPKLSNGLMKWKVRVAYEEEWHGATAINWLDMCEPCHTAVGKQIGQMQEAARRCANDE
jgi:hypothetical protein